MLKCDSHHEARTQFDEEHWLHFNTAKSRKGHSKAADDARNREMHHRKQAAGHKKFGVDVKSPCRRLCLHLANSPFSISISERPRREWSWSQPDAGMRV